jgi:chromosome segregation ATPase
VLFLVPTSYDDETILGLKRTIKELGLNQSYHYYVLQNYSRGLEDFRQQMTSVTSDVSNIKDSLKEAPQMLNIGKELDSLKSSLATYGATISDLKLSLAELKESPTSSTGAQLEALNATLQARLDFITEDLHHHHV